LIGKERIVHLPPFLDAVPYAAAIRERKAHRERLVRRHGLDPAMPWIMVAAMMRAGDKLASYRALAATLGRLTDVPWQLVVAGDGSARREVEAAFAQAAPGRAFFLGTMEGRALVTVYAACDLYAWPAVNEAYGMAMLEAQAAGLPVVSHATRGVPDVVENGRGGILVADGDDLARPLRELLVDANKRTALGRAAASFVASERSLEAAAERLKGLLARL
jgi:glycosyltransferase involved in cell wall biosynthesis